MEETIQIKIKILIIIASQNSHLLVKYHPNNNHNKWIILAAIIINCILIKTIMQMSVKVIESINNNNNKFNCNILNLKTKNHLIYNYP